MDESRQSDHQPYQIPTIGDNKPMNDREESANMQIAQIFYAKSKSFVLYII